MFCHTICVWIQTFSHKMKEWSFLQKKVVAPWTQRRSNILFFLSLFPSSLRKRAKVLHSTNTQNCQLSLHKHEWAHEIWKKEQTANNQDTHRVLNLWCADRCFFFLWACEPTSPSCTLTASWSRAQEATPCICPQTQWDFPHATVCLLLLHQLIRADNFLTYTVLQMCAKKIKINK